MLPLSTFWASAYKHLSIATKTLTQPFQQGFSKILWCGYMLSILYCKIAFLIAVFNWMQCTSGRGAQRNISVNLSKK
ncbi:hypothetical protein C7Y66_01435 [Chroococcidiopsis sp. CCALA 051]|nr:hypothetical protein C7Y66_01435 [Chroococcidiopsis sp. CCALA 051]